MVVESVMFRFVPSIRQKIFFGYYAIVAIIIALSIFTFIQLEYMDQKIRLGETVSEFFDTTLEVRRFEKNYFLYEKDFDFEENAKHVKKAQETLSEHEKDFTAVVRPEQISALKDALAEYERLMGEYALLTKRNVVGMRRVELEGMIRRAGKDIITTAEVMSKMERRSLQASLERSRRVLIISILTLAVLGIAIGRVLARIVVKPLKSLEESMGVIAEGRFERVAIDSKDREIVSLTAAFNKMLKELELHERHLIQSEKLASLGTLLSGVAHELNNPLSNISSSAQILADEIDGDDMDHKRLLVSQINEQTARARNIVRSLLDFSRNKEFKKETLSLRRLIDETIRFVRGEMQTGVEIEVSVPDDLTIFADKQRIQQVFLNLIKNAVEAIGRGEGTVSIHAVKSRAMEKSEEPGAGIYNYVRYRGKCTLEDDTVDIEIKDTGPGIPPETLPKIFDPFFTTKDVGKGSGLGLFIVREIVGEHDGCIAVDSEPGKGTIFLIRLPVK